MSEDRPTAQAILEAAQRIDMNLTLEAAERLARGESLHPDWERHHFLPAVGSTGGCDGVCFGRIGDFQFCITVRPPSVHICRRA